jgi:rare lipoprotein A
MVLASGVLAPVTRTASVYSDYFHGRKMANGRTFSQHKVTAASNDWPLGTKVKLTHKTKTLVVTITDRMAKRFTGRRIDLSKSAWNVLTGNAKPGLRPVVIHPVSSAPTRQRKRQA